MKERLPLPPLAAVRAFEAAARHGSFTRAATELGMTQAAVSYQIKLLEERMGMLLFLRAPRQVTLTDPGKALARSVSEAFDLLRGAFAAVRGDADGVLVVSAVQAFASNWLAPRLGRFQLAHPSLAVRLDATNHMTDFAREPVDVAIRTGLGAWPGLTGHRLLPVCFTPLCSPELLQRLGPLRHPADLLRLPLLSPSDIWWQQWLELAGLPAASLEGRPGIRLDSQQIEGRAALAGQGVAMLTPLLWAEELRAGKLVQPFDLIAHKGHHYWLVYPPAHRNLAKVRLWRDWLLAEVERETTGAA